MATRKTPELEWTLCDEECEWVAQSRPPLDAVEPHKGKGNWIRVWGAPSILVVLGLTLVGGWSLWQEADKGIALVEADVANAVSGELWSAKLPDKVVLHSWQEAYFLEPISVASNIDESVTRVEVRELGSDWATGEVWIQPKAASITYRQTRAYRYTEQGWQRAPATTGDWGAARLYESQYFTFHYRALDEEAVTQAATRLDALYPALFASLFGEMPAVAKQQITVDPAYVPQTLSYGQGIAQESYVVPSPAATLRPAEMAAGDLLLQSLMLALYQPLAYDAAVHYNLTEQWVAIFDGLRLWLIWEHDLPLALWREPLVGWLLQEPNQNTSILRSDLVAFAGELCLHHNLWMHSPYEIGIPILCVKLPGSGTKYLAWHYHRFMQGIAIASLPYSPDRFRNNNGEADVPSSAPGYAPVMLATMFEYVAATYGRERIPLLLAAIPAHQEAETLIPAVFDVSLVDFDQGWQEFLVQRYGLE